MAVPEWEHQNTWAPWLGDAELRAPVLWSVRHQEKENCQDDLEVNPMPTICSIGQGPLD